MLMSKVIRLQNKTDLVTNCLAYFLELGIPAPDRSTIFHYLSECFPGIYIFLKFFSSKLQLGKGGVIPENILNLGENWLDWLCYLSGYF